MYPVDRAESKTALKFMPLHQPWHQRSAPTVVLKFGTTLQVYPPLMCFVPCLVPLHVNLTYKRTSMVRWVLEYLQSAGSQDLNQLNFIVPEGVYWSFTRCRLIFSYLEAAAIGVSDYFRDIVHIYLFYNWTKNIQIYRTISRARNRSGLLEENGVVTRPVGGF